MKQETNNNSKDFYLDTAKRYLDGEIDFEQILKMINDRIANKVI